MFAQACTRARACVCFFFRKRILLVSCFYYYTLIILTRYYETAQRLQWTDLFAFWLIFMPNTYILLHVAINIYNFWAVRVFMLISFVGHEWKFQNSAPVANYWNYFKCINIIIQFCNIYSTHMQAFSTIVQRSI